VQKSQASRRYWAPKSGRESEHVGNYRERSYRDQCQVLGSIANTSEQSLAGFVLGLASFVISIWALVELGSLRGAVGPNRYGPDPLQRPDVLSVAPASAGP
jgi:hypothetical protein